MDLNEMVIADKYADAKGLWLTANDTTVYAMANVDLGKARTGRGRGPARAPSSD